MIDFDNPRNREAWLTLGGIAFMAAAFIALVLFLSSCHHVPEPLPPMPDTAEAACANLSRLQCPEARPTKSGVMCPELVAKASRLRNMNLGCVANAPDIDALRDCGSVRCVW